MLVAKVMAGTAIVIGLWLTYETGWLLLVIGLLGLLGGYFYTGSRSPIKNQGFGVVAVFLFTGILMVLGSYVADYRALLAPGGALFDSGQHDLQHAVAIE